MKRILLLTFLIFLLIGGCKRLSKTLVIAPIVCGEVQTEDSSLILATDSLTGKLFQQIYYDNIRLAKQGVIHRAQPIELILISGSSPVYQK